MRDYFDCSAAVKDFKLVDCKDFKIGDCKDCLWMGPWLLFLHYFSIGHNKTTLHFCKKKTHFTKPNLA
jgi:hypothetical protein